MTTISTMFSGLVRTFLLAWDYRRAWWLLLLVELAPGLFAQH